MVYRTPGGPTNPRVVVSLAARTDPGRAKEVGQTFLVTDVSLRTRTGGPGPLRASWTSPYRVVAAAYHAFPPWIEDCRA